MNGCGKKGADSGRPCLKLWYVVTSFRIGIVWKICPGQNLPYGLLNMEDRSGSFNKETKEDDLFNIRPLNFFIGSSCMPQSQIIIICYYYEVIITDCNSAAI